MQLNQAMLKQQLLKRKHRVIVASDGEEAVDVFIRHREEIDVVLMDLAVRSDWRDLLVPF